MASAHAATAQSASFILWRRVPDRIRFAVAVLAAGLVAGLWTAGAHPVSARIFAENAFLRTLLLVLGGALWVGRHDLASLVRPPSRAQGWMLAAAVLAGTAARFALTPVPFHADNWMHLVTRWVGREPRPEIYSDGFAVFMRLFVIGPIDAEHAIFLGNRLAGSLLPLALYGLARVVLRNQATALWAAWLVALAPLAARLSSSESLQALPTLLTTVGVLGFAAHASAGSRPLLLAGWAAFAYAVLTRPDACAVAVAVPLAYAIPAHRVHLRDPWLWGGVAALVSLAVPLVLLAMNDDRMAHLTSVRTSWSNVVESLRAAGRPHGALAIGAVAGLLILVEGGDAWAALLAVAALAARVEVAGFEQSTANRLQLLYTELPWMALAASVVPPLLVRIGARRGVWGGRIAGAAAGVAMVVVVARAPFWTLVWGQHQEWLFLQRVLPRVRAQMPGVPFVRADQADGTERRLDPQPVPDAAFPDRPIVRIAEWTASAAKSPALYYRGLNCYLYDTNYDFVPRPTPDAPGTRARLNASCGAFEARHRLTPLATVLVDAPPSWTDYWSGDRQPLREIGFFELDGDRGR